MHKALTVLGIETSCDETAAAIVTRSQDGKGTILAQKILSQIANHKPFGGVVPEIAARQHIVHLDKLIKGVFDDSKIDLKDLDAIAATAGPGLLGGLIVGLNMAKALAIAANKPFLAINHLEGHALTPGLTEGLRPPYLLLLVSGGHTQLLAIDDIAVYRRYGTTLDDALGEAFDKVAKILGEAYPGGPHVEKLAQKGDPHKFDFPRPLYGKPGCHFSFSGLKTAVRLAVENTKNIDDALRHDIAASFQEAVVESLIDRLSHAMTRFENEHSNISKKNLVIAGGVAANHYIRNKIEQHCNQKSWSMILPPPSLCTDNAAMIAWAGIEKFARNHQDNLDAAARARWPLDPTAELVHGAGVKA